jgi:hypothetical protein
MLNDSKNKACVEAEGEIDRGYSFQKWQELENQGVVVKSYEEKMKLGSPDRDPELIRVKYSVLKDLKRGDSIFFDCRYGVPLTRSAAMGHANRTGQTFITRQSYEGGRYGLRVFRLY